jgi:hypothetical protein
VGAASAEAPGLGLLAQLSIGRGDEAHVHRAGLAAADAHDLALLHDAQERDLRLGRDLADLVQEHGAAVGRLEEAGLRLARPWAPRS